MRHAHDERMQCRHVGGACPINNCDEGKILGQLPELAHPSNSSVYGNQELEREQQLERAQERDREQEQQLV